MQQGKLTIRVIAQSSILLALSILFMYQRIPLLYGIEYTLVTIPLWIAFRRMGLLPALLLSLCVCVFGFYFYNESYDLLMIPTEIIVVGLLVRNTSRKLVPYTLIYWVTIGLLLDIICYLYLNQGMPSYLFIHVLFHAFTAITNALLGDMLASYLPLFRELISRKWKSKVEIRSLAHYLAIFTAIIPLFLFLLLSSRYFEKETIRSVNLTITTLSARVNEKIDQSTPRQLRDFRAQHLIQISAMQELFNNLTTEVILLLVDEDNTIIASVAEDYPIGSNLDVTSGSQFHKVNHELLLRQPESKHSLRTQVWSESDFISVRQLDKLDYRLIAIAPLVGSQKEIFGLYSFSLGIVLILVLALTFLYSKAAKKLTDSLTSLGKVTSSLPQNVKENPTILWKESGLAEVDILRDNFIETSYALASMFQNIDEKNTLLKKSKDELSRLVHYDSMTGIRNRYSFMNDLQRKIDEEHPFLLVFIDLDHFKFINDTYGHAAGDAVLKAMGDRLCTLSSPEYTGYRLAGDEFILIANEPLPTEAMLKGMHSSLTKEPISFEGRLLTLHLSMGISHYPKDGRDLETLLSKADSAMYKAKTSGRNRVISYSKQPEN